MTDRFDVFLCHNSEDKSEVQKIGLQLKENGLHPWLDNCELRPGMPWQRLLENHIDKIDAVAVFLGSSGIGPWQQMELDAIFTCVYETELSRHPGNLAWGI
jgi:hypothetical protein